MAISKRLAIQSVSLTEFAVRSYIIAATPSRSLSIMNQDALKQAVARAALDYVKERLKADSVIGIGTGSTANFFIDYLAELRDRFAGAVASSDASAQRLKQHGIEVLDLNSTGSFDIYVDGADEANANLELIKGGG